ncbi:hypothetical protein FRC08_011585, partial [Ceratobasidium sp. 394]
MLNDFKRNAKEKLGRVFGRKHGTSASQSLVGGPATDDTHSGPEANPVDLSAVHSPLLAALSRREARDVTPRRDPASKQPFKDTAWAGLKTLLGVLSESADAFPPLKSAVGGLVRCIEIYDNQAAARGGYDKLRAELNDLCQDISGYVRGAATPSMTPCIANLARGIEVETELVLQKGRRNAVQRYAGAMEDGDEILECYRRIQMHLERLALNANLDVWKIVDEQAT